MWWPSLGLRGIFQMTFFPHVTVLSGVGVGGGSLVYANTLPDPEGRFLQRALVGRTSPTGRTSSRRTTRPRERMLGATENPLLTVRRPGDPRGGPGPRARSTSTHRRRRLLRRARRDGPDPYFGGEGPARTGCIACGGCMIGLPLRRQEHARQELPLPRREAGPDARGRDRGRPRVRPRSRRRLCHRGAAGRRRAAAAAPSRHATSSSRAACWARCRCCSSSRPRPRGCRGSRTSSGTSCAPTPSRSSG